MKKISVRQLLPIIHFLLSFLYERTILIFELDKNIVASIPKNQIFSDTFERVLAYILAKVIAFVLIWYLWKLIFFVKDNLTKSRTVLVSLILFLVGICVFAFFYPSGFLRSSDNYITYSYAKRLLPEYWHNAYSSYVYCAMLMVLPHPVAISLTQWIALVFALGYLSYRIEQSPVLQGKGKWFMVLLPLIPFSWALYVDGYRTEQYAITSMIYISILGMDMVDKKKRSAKEIILLLLFSAFLAVWRSEGIIVGVLAFAVALLWAYELPWKKIVWYMAGLVVAFLLVSFPQKIGDIKYYGKDYSMVNSFSILQNMLNAPDSNLLYEGVEEDLEAISQVTPIDAIQLYGLDGYRRYNVICGRPDINQSLADDETSAAFMKAYYRMLLHNIKIYAKTQITNVTSIWGIKGAYDVPAPFEDTGEYPKWTYDAWNIGMEDYLAEPLVFAWVDNYCHQITYLKITAVVEWLANLRNTWKLDLFMYLMIPFVEGIMVLREFILLVKRKKGNPGLGALALILLGLFGAIMLVMPAGLLVYFHSYYYMSLIVTGVYIITTLVQRKKKTA